MKKVVCSVFDVKSAIYSNPFYSPNVAVADRDFKYACQDSTTALSRHPDDYVLYCLAEFDDESGLFTSHTPPVFIASGSDSKIPF